MALYSYPPINTVLTGGATEAKQDSIIANQVTQTSHLSAIQAATEASLSPVDFLDSGTVDTSSSAIPTTGLQVVAALAQNCDEIEVVEDIGEFMALTDGSDNILSYLPLGGGRVKVSISTGTEIKIKSLTGSSITLGSIAINFLG